MARYRRGALGERILIPDSPARGGAPKSARAFTGTTPAPSRMTRATARPFSKRTVGKPAMALPGLGMPAPLGAAIDLPDSVPGDPWNRSLPGRTGPFGEDLGEISGANPDGPEESPLEIGTEKTTKSGLVSTLRKLLAQLEEDERRNI